MLVGSSEGILGKLTGISQRIRLIGATSEQALYARTYVKRLPDPVMSTPNSARDYQLSHVRLEQDSASLILQGHHSGRRS
ncbi:hypothetical protein FHS72_001091 [Loktanella ponticola]|uniref:Uncharacterized protein n=1 Tax=Yoonia ponticola TaxID=1524255 RepID=A0A7W9EXC1_9RHOB|nr:hypothetical protein [Yoonia ponticola]MBB5721479.1 hypothetical protein [Yoonia ponticola]